MNAVQFGKSWFNRYEQVAQRLGIWQPSQDFVIMRRLLLAGRPAGCWRMPVEADARTTVCW